MYCPCAIGLAASLFAMTITPAAAIATQNVTAVTAADDLEPDRPDVTNGTHIVDVGLMQMEVGAIWTRGNAGQHSLGTPSTIRVGLSEWLEARVSSDGFVQVADASGLQHGLGNVQLGAKLRLWADPGGVPVLSILPTVNLPTAQRGEGVGLGPGGLHGGDADRRRLPGAWAHQHGVGRIGVGPRLPRFTQQLVSWSASAEVPGPVTPYLEGFWVSRQDPDGGHIAALSGAIYVVNPRFALDGGVQFGLTDASAPLAAFAGVSVVLGNVLGDHGVHARQREVARRGAARAAKVPR